MRWSLFDQLGSTVGLIDASRVLTDAYRFDPYGETVATYPTSSGTANPWRFRGLLDLSPSSAPLYEMNARDYSPGSGTFTSLDTVMGSAMDPLTMNRYLYAEANPTTLIDPSGHCSLDMMITCAGTPAPKPPPSAMGGSPRGGGTASRPAPSGGSRAPSGTGTTTPTAPSELPAPGSPACRSSDCRTAGSAAADDHERAARARLSLMLAARQQHYDDDVIGGLGDGIWNATIGGLLALPGALADDPLGTLGCMVPNSPCQTQSTVRMADTFVHGSDRDRAEVAGNVLGQFLALALPAKALGGGVKSGANGAVRTLADRDVVVFGGTAELPAAGVRFSGSVGTSLADAAAGVPHGTVRSASVGDIVASGGRVKLAPEFAERVGRTNFQHVDVCLGSGRCPFGAPAPNPVPPRARFGGPDYPYETYWTWPGSSE